jgi:hypothetical protein
MFLFASDLCCIQVFHVANISGFIGMFRESWGQDRALGKGPDEPGAGRWSARRVWGPADGACLSSSRLPNPVRTDRGWGQGKEWRAQPGCAKGAR